MLVIRPGIVDMRRKCAKLCYVARALPGQMRAGFSFSLAGRGITFRMHNNHPIFLHQI